MKIIKQSGECCPADLDMNKLYLISDGAVYEIVQENVRDRILELIEEHSKCCMKEIGI